MQSMLRTTSPVQHLWDLRHGDADDDRSSPHGRGWASMIFAAALEFNYLTAPIAFVLLIGGPALLIGFVPPILATYGLWAFGVSRAESRVVVAIPLALILVAAALTVALPLIRRTMRASWELKYALILPLFVALREAISLGLERLPGQVDTAEQFSRRRRIGAAIAALLLAGGAIAVAIIVEFSSGGRLVAAMNVRVWIVAIAGLRNAVVVLAVWTAVTGIGWLWREITTSLPVRDWVPSTAAPGSSHVRVAHLSDLHVVGGRYAFRMESGTRGPRGNGRMRRAIRQLADVHAETPLDRILVSGDITDAGTRAEWIAFTKSLHDCPELREKLLFVPGNHDVNVVDATNPGRLDLPGSMGQALRKLRVVLALDEFQGMSVRVVDRISGVLGPTLSEYLRTGARRDLLRELADRGTRRGRRELRRVWEEIFPLVVPPQDAEGYGIMLLDSNALRHLSLTNAIGVVGRSQLKATRSILRSAGNRSWLILLHHHVVEYPVPSIGLKERIGLSLANAPEVLEAISAHGSHVVVLHGHRHRAWIGARDRVTLCSAPSVTLGAYNLDRSHGYFHVYELAYSADAGMQLSSSRTISVA